MKRNDVKRLLKNAYPVEPSERKTAFLQTYQPRQMNYRELLGLQFQYMGPQLVILYGYALAIFLGIAAHADAALARLFAALMPALALLALTGLGKSARYGMEEMEMASRFSLRMLKILRLALVGLAGAVAMAAVSCVLKIVTGVDLLCSLALACIPYLATTFFSMLLIRKWHSRKNIYGCVAIALAVCLFTFCGAELMVGLSRGILWAALLGCAFLAGSEISKYLKESETLQWSLC